MTPSTKTDRQTLRKQFLALRDNLTPEARKTKSGAVLANFWRIGEIKNISTLLSYVNFRSEVETLPLIKECLERGIRVAVPLTLPEEQRLAPFLLSAPERQLRPGFCSIPEPDPGQAEALNPREIDAVILPGSVFDVRGGRLGYGGGYYDRFLDNEAPQALRIGLGFDLQVVPAVPLLPHDKKLDYLVTEKRVIKI